MKIASNLPNFLHQTELKIVSIESKDQLTYRTAIYNQKTLDKKNETFNKKVKKCKIAEIGIKCIKKSSIRFESSKLIPKLELLKAQMFETNSFG